METNNWKLETIIQRGRSCQCGKNAVVSLTIKTDPPESYDLCAKCLRPSGDAHASKSKIVSFYSLRTNARPKSHEHNYKCYVCHEPIMPAPQPHLPIDANLAQQELMAGMIPKICISCGGRYDFRRSRRKTKIYIEFLTEHSDTELEPEEIYDFIWNSF
jgi:hypothetical protein